MILSHPSSSFESMIGGLARSYLKMRGLMPDFEKWLQNELGLNANSLVLVLDGGSGEILSQVMPLCGQGMVEFAEGESYPFDCATKLVSKKSWRHVNMHRIKAAAAVKSLGGMKFDAIIWLGLNRGSNPLEVLAGSKELLDAGSKLAVLCIDSSDLQKIWFPMKGRFVQKLRIYNRDELRSLLATAGFSNSETKKDGIFTLAVMTR